MSRSDGVSLDWIAAGQAAGLGKDIDRRSVPDHRIDLFDLPVCDGNASGGPVLFVQRVNAAPWAAMDEDVTARRLAIRFSKSPVGVIWIRNADGQME